MDTYEVHVPCGKKVLVVCKEKGEDVELKKNGQSVYNETKTKTNNTGDLPRLIETKKANETPEAEEAEPEAEEAPETEEKNSEESVENNMAGGKKTRRNNARKNNATRRKGQAGGKRGPNRYMKFANKVRPQILKEHPELKSDVVGVARKIGAKWRSLSEAEKAKY
jgi:hypothetical protein